MKIIDAIIDKWIDEERSSLFKKYSYYIDRMNEYKEQIDRQNEVLGQISELEKDEVYKYSCISNFLEYIGANPCVLEKYFPKPVQNDDVRSNIAESKKYIIEQHRDAKTKKEVYQAYLYIFVRLKDGNYDFIEERIQRDKYISSNESYIDIFIMGELAKKHFDESSYDEYNYRRYAKVLDVFSPNMMKKLNHPVSDAIFTNGEAELICAICRLSWEIYYFDRLSERILQMNNEIQCQKGFEKMSAKNKREKLLKDSSFNSIFRQWEVDIDTVMNYENDTVFLNIFNEIVSTSEISQYKRFVDELYLY